MMRHLFLICLAFNSLACPVSGDGLSHLGAPCDPYYPNHELAKLTTPQWVGEPDVDAVVILSIDDMRDSAKYEAFLRPVLDRLKKIDGRAPVSIFANAVDQNDSQLQTWLKEGLSLETHTADHPCPLLCDGDFAKAKSTYERCVDQLFSVPNNQPVAFRMPCCDSLNTPSPRFWSEIFDKTTASGNYLAIDSSVFNIFTQDDPDLPKELVQQADGTSRFRSYLPFPSFVNTIENYPYPYIINGTCWEFPCTVPSDWEAQHVQRPNNPKTVEDWKRALDATVVKQGVMPIVFHPHGWIRSEQLTQFIDYTDKTYGRRVKFLTFAEALNRIEEHLLGGVSLRNASGNQWKVHLIDLNQDGFMDVVRQDGFNILARVWNPVENRFRDKRTNRPVGEPKFGIRNDAVSFLIRDTRSKNIDCYTWKNNIWHFVDLRIETTDIDLRDADFSLLDMDHDGTSELFLQDADKTVVMKWMPAGFKKLPFEIPFPIADARLVDLNRDGHDDILRSTAKQQDIWIYVDENVGWQQKTLEPELAERIPSVTAADGTNNGAWFHSDHLWVQNEHTAHLPDHVDRVSYDDLLALKPKDAIALAPKSAKDVLGKAKSLDESLKTFAVIGKGRLEVAAAEPEIADPVAFDWGAHGELWVVEMGDYPNGANWHGPGDKKGDAGGRVKLLLDKDGDGRYETAHLFLDGLGVPTGIKAFRNGVIVTVAPHIIYAEDTDGDHIADKKEILYEGITEGNEQHRINGLRWGLDHWLHVANGESGGSVRSKKTGKTVNIRGRDFKIHPDTGGLELTSGQSQFGRNRDNVGNWFGGNNSEPAWHYVLDERYQGRNEFVESPSSRHIISKNPGASPVFPTSQTIERFNDFDRADRFTSACSTEISRNDAAAKTFVYVGEPVHNLVHRSELTRDGITFSSDRAANERDKEFLTSSDNWFRPVMVRYGPDDAVWVVDMYRQVIEHPEWIPMEWQKKIDHLGGNDKGRIYRVVFDTDDSADRERWKRIGKMSRDELIRQIDTPNGVVRDMIQQRLYESNSNGANLSTKSELQTKLLGARWKHARLPVAYLISQADNKVDSDTLSTAFRSGAANPRWLSVAADELNANSNTRDLFFAWLGKYAVAPEDRIPLAYLLGEISDARSANWLADMLFEAADAPHLRAAVMSSTSKSNIAAITELLLKRMRAEKVPVADSPLLPELLSVAIGVRDEPALSSIAGVMVTLDTPQEKLAALSTIRTALSRQNKTLEETFDTTGLQTLQEAANLASSIAAREDASTSTRLHALGVFGLLPRQKAVELSTLRQLLDPQHPPELQGESIRLLRKLGDSTAADDIFARWNNLSPAIRTIAVRESLRDEEWTGSLLTNMEQENISPREIGIQQQNQLREHKLETVKSRAAKLFQAVPTNRAGVIERYSKRPPSPADRAHGKQVFAKQCSACHQLEGQGRAVGPNLVALTDKSRPAMLNAILDPNRAVEDKYLDYTLVLESGEVAQGILKEESATSITLALASGEERRVLRNQIELMKSTGKSLMPEGLEQTVPPQDMDDVIAYVQSVRAKRKQFPGNAPQIAPVRDDDSIRMFAMHAEIYGPHLEFEPKYRNLGFWKTDQDRAVWTLHAKKAGRYEFNLDYACSPEHVNNRFQLRVNGQKLSGTVQATGSWDNYESKNIGTIWLPAEPVQVTLTSEGPVDGFLFDLRTIVLWPE